MSLEEGAPPDAINPAPAEPIQIGHGVDGGLVYLQVIKPDHEYTVALQPDNAAQLARGLLKDSKKAQRQQEEAQRKLARSGKVNGS